jgi:hypothetical protein
MLPIQVLTRHEAGVNCLAVYGNLVFTGSEDKDIKVITVFTKYQLYRCNFMSQYLFLRKAKTNYVFLFDVFIGVQVFQAVHCYCRLSSE